MTAERRREAKSGGGVAVSVEAAAVPAADGFGRDIARLRRHAEGRDEGPSLRLWRSRPAVAIGRDQALAREVRLSHCRAAGITVVRRPTGGGALWLDPEQVCLSLVVEAARLGPTPAARLADAAGLIGEGLSRLGVATAFRAPNDLEVVGGAKIASVFLAEEGAAALIFATVLVDFDIRSAMTALLVPTEKLTVTGLEHARERVTTLRQCLPDLGRGEIEAALVAAVTEGLGARPVPDSDPEARVAPLDDLLDHEDPWGAPLAAGFETEDKTGAATLRLRLETDPAGGAVTAARFATDAAFAPADLAGRIASALAGAAVAEVPARMASVADLAADAAVGFTGADLVRLAGRAVAKARLGARVGLDAAQTSGLMLAGAGDDAAEALGRATVMLVPYCAKPAWCALRPTPDCIDCGHCEVGDAYRLARERGLEVTTITNFEHLSETLAEMRARGVSAYVGMCCSDFFLKRHAAFREAGMDAVLMDIVGATCYELNEEHLAYAGAFKAEASLDLDALEKVMALVPNCATSCADACAPRPAGADAPPSRRSSDEKG